MGDEVVLASERRINDLKTKTMKRNILKKAMNKEYCGGTRFDYLDKEEISMIYKAMKEYHQAKLKLLGIGVVSTRLKMGAKVYKKDKTITGFIDRKADRGFNHWIVIWNNGEQTKEYGSDLNVC
jgi:hypothetical protein